MSVIHLLAVSPNHQGCGIARNIMHSAIDIAKSNNSKAVRLDALSCNTPAHRLYQSIGFEKISICKSIKEIPGFAAGTFDRDAEFRALISKETEVI